MDKPLVTIVTPTIKPRRGFLRRAVNSVMAQTYGVPPIEVAMDRTHEGAAVTRNRALMKVQTPWVAFLDDDDYLLPHHLQTLLEESEAQPGVDVFYPMCQTIDANFNPIDLSSTLRAGQPFSEEALRKCNYIPVTSMVRTDLAKAALFGPPDHAGPNDEQYEDYGFYLRLLDGGAKFSHVPEVTWVWHHHGMNTSGLGDRW